MLANGTPALGANKDGDALVGTVPAVEEEQGNASGETCCPLGASPSAPRLGPAPHTQPPVKGTALAQPKQEKLSQPEGSLPCEASH